MHIYREDIIGKTCILLQSGFSLHRLNNVYIAVPNSLNMPLYARKWRCVDITNLSSFCILVPFPSHLQTQNMNVVLVICLAMIRLFKFRT